MAGKVGPFERGVGKFNLATSGNNWLPLKCHLLPLANGVGRYTGSAGLGMSAVIGGFHKPTCYILEGFPIPGALFKNGLQVGFLLFALSRAAQIRRITANIGFTPFVFKINFSLV